MAEAPLTEKEYRLQKFPGKGGWTYAEIPEIQADKHAHFGWVKVYGSIDTYALEKVTLMPNGAGKLILPVKADIRKKIKKEAGDLVKITLYSDSPKLIMPADLEECLELEPAAHRHFLSLPEKEQKEILDWIYAAKNEEAQVERIVKTIDKLLSGQSFRHNKS